MTKHDGESTVNMASVIPNPRMINTQFRANTTNPTNKNDMTKKPTIAFKQEVVEEDQDEFIEDDKDDFANLDNASEHSMTTI
jgi:hypothetical protein